MPLPEEVDQNEARQAGVSPAQVRQQRAQPAPPPQQARSAQSFATPSYAGVGPGAAAGSSTGMNPVFSERLMAMIAASGGKLKIVSGFRSHAEQQALWDRSAKDGVMVARPGNSNHEKGIAADLGGDIAWAHAHAAEFGLYFPMSWEPWHIEPVGSRSGATGAASVGYVGPKAGASGYTKARPGYSLNEDPASSGASDPKKSIGFQLSSLGSILDTPAFWMGGPASLPSDFSSMPAGTA